MYATDWKISRNDSSKAALQALKEIKRQQSPIQPQQLKPAPPLVQTLLKDIMVKCERCKRDVKAGDFDTHECSTLPTKVEVKMASRVLKRLASTSPEQTLLCTGGKAWRIASVSKRYAKTNPLSRPVACRSKFTTPRGKITKSIIPLNIVQLVFDEFSEKLTTALEDLTWGGIDEALKCDLVKSVESHLQLYKHTIPPRKVILKRLKNYYSSRRNSTIINENPEKKAKRRLALKLSRLTYIARDKAVQEAVQVGTLNPSNSEEVKAFRITVPTPELPTYCY
ncbi:hypothetical protein EMCRGX_G005056 [Ephydatia muelleri]